MERQISCEWLVLGCCFVCVFILHKQNKRCLELLFIIIIIIMPIYHFVLGGPRFTGSILWLLKASVDWLATLCAASFPSGKRVFYFILVLPGAHDGLHVTSSMAAKVFGLP